MLIIWIAVLAYKSLTLLYQTELDTTYNTVNLYSHITLPTSLKAPPGWGLTMIIPPRKWELLTNCMVNSTDTTTSLRCTAMILCRAIMITETTRVESTVQLRLNSMT